MNYELTCFKVTEAILPDKMPWSPFQLRFKPLGTPPLINRSLDGILLAKNKYESIFDKKYFWFVQNATVETPFEADGPNDMDTDNFLQLYANR